MSTAATIVGVLVGVVALAGALWRVGRGIWQAGKRTQELVGALNDNTTATSDLSAKFEEHTAKVGETFADHERRITRLETRRRA